MKINKMLTILLVLLCKTNLCSKFNNRPKKGIFYNSIELVSPKSKIQQGNGKY